MNQVVTTRESAKTLTLIVYILQASLFFTGGLTALVGVIINYIKVEDVDGTWLASHFRWQIRTFWFALLWCFIGGITAFFLVGFVILAVTGIWVIYRVVKGILRLLENKEMYVQPVAAA